MSKHRSYGYNNKHNVNNYGVSSNAYYNRHNRNDNNYGNYIYNYSIGDLVNRDRYVPNFESENINFENTGNACFMDSVLEIYLHIPKMLSYLKSHNSSGKKLIKGLVKLSEYPYNKENLRNIRKLMSEINEEYEKGQQDSQDFGMELLGAIKDEIINENFSDHTIYESNTYNKKQIKLYKIENFENYCQTFQNDLTFIDELFRMEESRSIYTHCQLNKVSFSSYFQIELVFPNNNCSDFTLYDLIENRYSFDEDIQEKMNTFEPVTINRLAKLPQILCFSFDRAVMGRPLITANVDFYDEINMVDYCDKHIINVKNVCTSYTLFAINECRGNFKSSGHYTCNVKIKDTWWNFDDLRYSTRQQPSFSSRNVTGLYYIRDDVYDI